MKARLIPPSELADLSADDLAGAVLLASVRLEGEPLRKGRKLDLAAAGILSAAARQGSLTQALRLGWLEPGDLHEDDAARQLALAVAGTGVELRPPRLSRLDLLARWDGVLRVQIAGLARLNTLDLVEVFTLYDGQALTAGRVVASVKVAPHIVPEATIREAVRLAGEGAPLVEVRPYLPLQVGAIAQESLTGDEVARFEDGARRKVESLGSRFVGTIVVSDTDPVAAEREARNALLAQVRNRGLPVVLVGGVSAGDPLSPFFSALESLGGKLLRRGVPAHPGSMIWLAQLDQSRLLGLPQCGTFSMATAADLVLCRLLTGEALSGADLASLAHGGVLTPDMRFRFPPYARDLEDPKG